jgi:hypothetical protein
MPLSCSCGEDDGEGIYWYEDEDFAPLDAKRAQRCSSCKSLVKIGEECLTFKRFRFARDDVEIKIYGEDTEIDLAPHHHCAKCGEQYLNLTALGYCVSIDEDVFEVLSQYWCETGFDPNKYATQEKA